MTTREEKLTSTTTAGRMSIKLLQTSCSLAQAASEQSTERRERSPRQRVRVHCKQHAREDEPVSHTPPPPPTHSHLIQAAQTHLE